MSTLAAWSYESTLTVWPAASYDAYGQPTFGTPYTVAGSWSVGGDMQTDDNGEQFVAASKYYFEYDPDSATLPARGGFIKRGTHTSTADPIAAGAEKIRKVAGFDMAMFGATEVPDWIVYT